MKMKLMKSLAVIAAVTLLPMTAFAGGTGGSGGTDIDIGVDVGSESTSGAIANALVKSGAVYNNGSLGCPTGLMTPWLGLCWRDKFERYEAQAMLVIAIEAAGYDLNDEVVFGTFYRALQYKVSPAEKVAVGNTTASTKAADSSSTTKVVKVNGKRFTLSGDMLDGWMAGETLTFQMDNGRKIKASRRMVN